MKEMAHTPGEWIVPRSLADMPAKPGVYHYEYVDCLVLYKGELCLRPWNCEHQVFDDENRDDHFCDWDQVEAYRSLSGDLVAAKVAVAEARAKALPTQETKTKEDGE
ncbi:hypothetical protein [Sphingomonas sp. MA1305]|uniref:hypothetical protein n=1 Tax=Sphingomonas sp. MA1305 TaxID=2479204 RepID=UPI0018DF6226|nr:hypothetical protein [Sphingomonas sp. MA1305]